MSGALVSVIVPVYNGENYIRHSIQTVYEQTYRPIEIIAIDDGSSDQSLLILKQLAEQALKGICLKIHSQKNKGICEARNQGIRMADGEYIMFMDQDDRLKPDCIKDLQNKIEKEDADIVIGGFDLINEEGGVLERWELKEQNAWSPFQITAPWGRLFKKELIDRFDISFMQTKISEDFYFNMLYLSFCNKIAVIPQRGYCWLFHLESESHAKMSCLSEERNPVPMLLQLHQKMQKPNSLPEDCVEYMMVKYIIWYLFYVARGASGKDLALAYDQCFQWLREAYPVFFRNRLIRFGRPAGERFRTRAIVRIAVTLWRCRLLRPFLNIYRRL